MGGRSNDEPKPRSITFTPSQLLGRVAGVGAGARSPERPKLPRLPAEDGLAIWFANPGDVLPDGSIATPLASAQPFEYTPEPVSDDAEKLAASTNSEDYAAKMLGYNRKTFGRMIHVMKEDNGLRGDDNVIWHDNGDVEFNGNVIDNMHAYVP